MEKNKKSEGFFINMTTMPNNSEDQRIDMRVIIEPDEEIYEMFLSVKNDLGIKSNAETARVLIKKGFEYLKSSGFIKIKSWGEVLFGFDRQSDQPHPLLL